MDDDRLPCVQQTTPTNRTQYNRYCKPNCSQHFRSHLQADTRARLYCLNFQLQVAPCHAQTEHRHSANTVHAVSGGDVLCCDWPLHLRLVDDCNSLGLKSHTWAFGVQHTPAVNGSASGIDCCWCHLSVLLRALQAGRRARLHCLD